MFDLCWDDELKKLFLKGNGDKVDCADNWILKLYQNLLVPLAIPTAMLAGSAMHFILKPIAMGKMGVSWCVWCISELLGLYLSTLVSYPIMSGSCEEPYLVLLCMIIINTVNDHNNTAPSTSPSYFQGQRLCSPFDGDRRGFCHLLHVFQVQRRRVVVGA